MHVINNEAKFERNTFEVWHKKKKGFLSDRPRKCKKLNSPMSTTHAKKMFARFCFCHDEAADDERHRNHIEFDQMTNEGSQYSLTGIPLPPLGATSAGHSGRHKLRSYIVSRYNPRYRYAIFFQDALGFTGSGCCIEREIEFLILQIIAVQI